MIPDAQSSLGAALRGALATAACLGGGLIVGMAAGFAANEINPNLAVLLALFILGFAGALWGRLMAQITGSVERQRMISAGAITFGPGILAAAVTLSALEVVLVERGGAPDLPIHVVYTLLFAPASLLVAALGGLALGLAQRSGFGAVRAALVTGLAAGLAFLAADLLMDAIGYRVGAPGAAERATMLTVTLVGSVAGALAGGAAAALSLRRRAAVEQSLGN